MHEVHRDLSALLIHTVLFSTSSALFAIVGPSWHLSSHASRFLLYLKEVKRIDANQQSKANDDRLAKEHRTLTVAVQDDEMGGVA